MGAIGGVICFFAATVVKGMFGYDDSLDAFGVHGVGGTVGAILTGLFASAAINAGIAGKYEGGGAQLGRQLIATVVTWVIAVVGSLILLKIVDLLIGLRVSESDEYDGLDLSQHGESGYNFEEIFPGSVSTDVGAMRNISHA